MKRHLSIILIIFLMIGLKPMSANALFEGELPDFQNDPKSAFETVFDKKPLKYQNNQSLEASYEGNTVKSNSATKLPMDYVRAYVKKYQLRAEKNDKAKRKVQMVDDNGIQKFVEEDATAIEIPSEQNQMTMDCDYMEYFADRNELEANGQVVITFPQDGTILKADKVVYNNAENTIKAFDNVVIIKAPNVMYGDYFQMNLNEETGIMDKPIGGNPTMEIKSKKGYVYGDTIVQDQGYMKITQSKRIKFKSQVMGMETLPMMTNNPSSFSGDIHEGNFRVKTKYLKIESSDKHDKITLKDATLYHEDAKIIKLPSMTFYTNKNHDYVEGNYVELGSMGYFGSFFGPGHVFEIPNGATLKVLPILNYQGGIGLGAMGKYKSATNNTTFGYGSAAKLFTVVGQQKLDDNLFIQYANNNFLNDGFMGRRWVKHAAELVYQKETFKPNFLIKNQSTSFINRWSAGYMQDMDVDIKYNEYTKNLFFDKDGKPLDAYNIGTSRFKYAGQISQGLWSYKNPEKLTSVALSLVAQGTASVYGTGDTQFIGRLGPSLNTQYKRWQQSLTYFQSAYSDNTPITIFDKYYLGHSVLYITETLKLHKLLAVSWRGAYNISGDSPNKRRLQENIFMLSIGPDDIKLNLALDLVTASTFIGLDVDMDAKDSKIEYEKFEIKNAETLGKKKSKKTIFDEIAEEEAKNSTFAKSDKNVLKPLLQKAIITEIKDTTLKMENET